MKHIQQHITLVYTLDDERFDGDEHLEQKWIGLVTDTAQRKLAALGGELGIIDWPFKVVAVQMGTCDIEQREGDE